MNQITPALRKKYYGKIREIAKECGYQGSITPEALDECANAYLMCCDDEGTPKPRRYMRSIVNGKATNLNEIQWLLAHTQLFNRWFGVSKVVDENGEPMVMYHGSDKVFKEFKPEAIKVKKSLMTLWSGPGFYFTDKKTIAEIYAKGEAEPMEVFVRLENPLVVDETGNAENGKGITKDAAIKIFLAGDNTDYLDRMLPSELARLTGEPTMKFKNMSRQNRVKRFVGLLKTDVVMLKTCSQAYHKGSQKKMLDAICRYSGHDGVIHTLAPGLKEYIVYNPTAIKSATGNDGEFSRSSAVVMDEGNDLTEKKGANQMSSLIDVLKKLAAESAQGAKAQDVTDKNGHEHDKNGKFTSKGGSGEGNFAANGTKLALPGKFKVYKDQQHGNLFDAGDEGKSFYADSEEEVPNEKLPEDVKSHMGDHDEEDNIVSRDGKFYARHTQGGAIYSYDPKEEEVDRRDDGGHASYFGEDGKEAAMDIVDRNGRHHERKGIPPGGQFENEAPYRSGAEKAEHFVREAGRGEQGNHIRQECAKLYHRMNLDTKGSEFHRGHFNGLSHSGMVQMLKDHKSKEDLIRDGNDYFEKMKGHAEAFEQIKNMNREDFRAWLGQHEEYNTPETQALLARNGTAKIKDANGNYVNQDHEIWEEAKWQVGRNAIANMMMFLAHSDALNNMPQPMLENMEREAVEHEAARPQPVENNVATPAQVENQGDDFEAAARRFAEAHHIDFHPSHTDELKNFVEKAEAGNIDFAEPNTGLRSNDMRFANDIVNALGENHPISQRLKNAIQEHRPQNGGQPAPAAPQHPEGSVAHQHNLSEEQMNNIAEEMSDDLGEAASAETVKEALRNPDHTDFQQMAQQITDRAFDRVRELLDDDHPLISQMRDARTAFGRGNRQEPANEPQTQTANEPQAITHNEGGLKATIHPSELAAVQGEMANAFTAARNGEEGAEEYAHALSHFLGRGNDNRSPHPGMRQDGIMKHQLADKMVNRLQEKSDAVEAATQRVSNDPSAEAAEALRNASRDRMATKKAIRKIAELTGITADMLPEEHQLRSVLGEGGDVEPPHANNPEHQPLMNALHNIAHPEATTTASTEENTETSANQQGSETPSDEDIASATEVLNQQVGNNDYRPVIQRAFQDPHGTGAPAASFLRQHLDPNHPVIQSLNRAMGRETPTEVPQPSTRTQAAVMASPEDINDAGQRILAHADRSAVASLNPGGDVNRDNIATVIESTIRRPNRGDYDTLLNILPDSHPVMRAIAQNGNFGGANAQQTPTRPTDAQLDEIADHLAEWARGQGNSQFSRESVRNILSGLANGENPENAFGFRSPSDFVNSAWNHVEGLSELPAFQALRNYVAANAGNRVQPTATPTPEPSRAPAPTPAPQPSNTQSHLRSATPYRGNDGSSISIPKLSRDVNINAGAIRMPRRRDFGNGERYVDINEMQRPGYMNGLLTTLNNTAQRFLRMAHPGMDIGEAMRNVLANPYNQKYKPFLNYLKDYTNRHPSAAMNHFRAALNGLHDFYGQENGNKYYHTWRDHIGEGQFIPRNSANSVADMNDEEFSRAVDQIKEHPDYNRYDRSTLESNLRRAVSSGDMTYIEDYRKVYGSESRVVKQILRHATEAARQREEARAQAQQAKNWRPTVDESERNRASEFARRHNIRLSDAPVELRGQSRGYNCYLNDAALFLQYMFGARVRPQARPHSYGDGNGALFKRIKDAMRQSGWKPLEGDTSHETLENVRSLTKDGTWISFWNGGHNTSAVRVNGKWYKHDGWHGDTWTATTAEAIASHLGGGPKSSAGSQWKSPSYAYIPGVSKVPEELFRQMEAAN